ncbi:unnamed protein product [Rotaria socialis]|nr:unnamed protein product [Rotaria socialis]CAF3573005.1 unnamed protein product [Rotaria socialis]CAF4422938.1 unnamed protein product [Rotaria socialis]
MVVLLDTHNDIAILTPVTSPEFYNQKYDRKQFNRNDSMANSFGVKSDYLQGVDCLNLSSRMVENKTETLNSSIVREFTEQHMSGFWKDVDCKYENVPKCPRNFTSECLHELLGSVTNLHVHIDSDQALYYSYEFIRQLKYEDPNLNVEISLDKKISDKPFIGIMCLIFECNQHYVLVYSKLEGFLSYVSACKSIEEITVRVESSVAFEYAISQGRPVQWHQNLSFVYMTAYQDLSIREVQDNLLKLNLQDLNFITKSLLAQPLWD